MYERVFLLRPVVAMPPGGPWEPCMRRWALVMPRGGGGMVGHYKNTMTEAWFDVNLHMFLPFPYAGMDFQGDLGMGPLCGYEWGLTCTFFFFLHLFEYICAYVL